MCSEKLLSREIKLLYNEFLFFLALKSTMILELIFTLLWGITSKCLNIILIIKMK